MPAPSVRYAFGEAFGLPTGTVTTGKMLTALKQLGFAHCWDTEFTADVTIWEEATEFVERLTHGKNLPILRPVALSGRSMQKYFALNCFPIFRPANRLSA